jgi:diguanylate cyclase (GGDEF)-like protein
MATTDKLTGLLNRQAFDMLIERIAAEARRKSEPVMLLLADIDHFKSINDRFGHLAGDRVLKRTATLLQQRLRGSDIVARWGGEEFLIALKDCRLEEAVRLAEELRGDVERLRVELDDGQVINLTLSIGISPFDGIEPIDAAIGRADTGLYEAKRSGRNRICVGLQASE